ncbi:MAG TPA: SRPBCC domain-containing protein [Saprospiraceae bacterium]|nr:SRPBCC domain-containing protein [Saprospiraceae bacterium]HMU04775.1 SRPBCC domain-containing protein [Saprospiraceae bacterium]
MQQKTHVEATENKQEIVITRLFNLSVDLLFKAYIEKDLVAQWMGTQVIKLDSHNHGSYIFETKDPMGNIHRFNGTIHDIEVNKKITRTFELENTSFPVQLEFLTFESVDKNVSKLTIKIIYKSVEDRDNMLKLPFAHGINIAHNRLEELFDQQN